MTNKKQPLIRLAYLDDIKLDPKDAPRISLVEFEELTASIASAGYSEPVIINRRTSRVIVGHHEIIAGRQLGLKKVPAVWVHVDPLYSTKQLRNMVSTYWPEGEDILLDFCDWLDGHS